VITAPTTPSFDTSKAFDFLTAQQQKGGSFGADLYTDWVGLALASGNNQPQTTKLIKYLGETKVASQLVTDYERRAMTLMALGLNPYDTNGENYITKIVASFDGKQFGDPNEDNDDIFALIVLQNAGYTQSDKMINSDINFILSMQNPDGSWNSNVDMTGATMEALSAFNQNEQVKTALGKAENYLEQNQKADGSWNDNASSTAWAIEGILAQNEKPADWSTSTNKNSPLDYLASIQDTDGGVKDSDLNTKIWETAYVVSALSGKTWNQTMQSFVKEDFFAPIVINPTTPTLKTENKIAEGETLHKSSTKQNTATTINAINPTPIATSTKSSQKNWLLRLLDRIF
jgi:prenyltransferase beta subunit